MRSKEKVFIYSSSLSDQGEEDAECKTIFRLYGINENQENVCLLVDDFEPFVYLELPEINNSVKIWYQKKNVMRFFQEFKKYIRGGIYEFTPPVRYEIEYKKKLYKYNINPDTQKPYLYPFIKLYFTSRRDIRKLYYYCNNKRRNIIIKTIANHPLNINIHQSEADELLQFFSSRNLPRNGWAEFRGNELVGEEKKTICDKEYKVSYKDIKRHEEQLNLSNPKILSFDIEVYSSDPSRMPDFKKDEDEIFQISCVIMNYTDNIVNSRKVLLTLGNPDPVITGEDVTILEYANEKELLMGFVDLTKKIKPHIITGYNILGFDVQYMLERSKLPRNRVSQEFRSIGFTRHFLSTEKYLSWSSTAFSNQEFKYIDSEGIVFIDLYPIVQREYKLDNYKLKTISTYFLGQSKDPLTAKDIFDSYKLGVLDDSKSRLATESMAICGKYCVQDSFLVMKLFLHLQIWNGMCEMSKICNVSLFSIFYKGQQIKVFSQVFKYCHDNNIVVDKDNYLQSKDPSSAEETYSGAYVFEPKPGVYSMVVPFDFASLYPTTIIAYNIDYSTFVENDNTSVKDEDCYVMDWEEHSGCEHDPVVIEMKRIDSEIEECKQEVEKKQSLQKKTADPFRKTQFKLQITEIKSKIKHFKKERTKQSKKQSKKHICKKMKYRFIKSHKGVIPTIMKNLLDARKNTRKIIYSNNEKIKIMSDPNAINKLKSQNDVLNKRQLAYKVSANSMYGAMGVKKGYIPFIEGAKCITYMGSQNIKKVARIITEKYGGELIYGDTDSNYIHFPNMNNPTQLWDYSEKVAAEISSEFMKPMKLEFEEVIYRRFMILSKKRYMYQSTNRDGDKDDKVGKKGVLLARRDNCKFIRNIYEETIYMIFNRQKYEDVIYFLTQKINDMFSKSLPIEEFVITKSIKNTDSETMPDAINGSGEEWDSWEKSRMIMDITGKPSNKIQLGSYKVSSYPTAREDIEFALKEKNARNRKEFYIKCLPAHVQLSERVKDRGIMCSAGSRIEYVLIDVNNERIDKLKQCEKIEYYEYAKKHCSVVKIGFLDYLKLLINPLDEVLNVIFPNSPRFVQDFTKNHYKARLQKYKQMIELRRKMGPLITFEPDELHSLHTVLYLVYL